MKKMKKRRKRKMLMKLWKKIEGLENIQHNCKFKIKRLMMIKNYKMLLKKFNNLIQRKKMLMMIQIHLILNQIKSLFEYNNLF